MSDEQGGAGAPTDEERARALREQLRNLHAFDLAYDMMISLVSFGYQKMGLTDETSDLRDLGDARLTIELLRATLEVVEREQGSERTRDVRSTLAQMQLGYAQAVQLAGAAPSRQARVAEPAEEAPRAKEPGDEAPKAQEPAAREAVSEDPAVMKAPRRPVATKPAAKKPAAKKPAAKKPAAKKPAAKKPAAKKPAAEGPPAKTAAPKKPPAKKPGGGASPAG
jgi:hypothetical protein